MVFGLIAIAIGIALLYAARYLYPRLELADEALASVRLLTAIIVALLLLGGLGLVIVGALM